MAKKMLLTIDGVQKKLKTPMLTVNGVHKKVKKAFLTVNGVHKLVFQSNMTLADLPVGSSVFMNMKGVPTEFLIVHQGLPDATMYDASCDDTWLLMRTVYGEDMGFGTNVDDFQSSDVRLELNDVIFFDFDASVQNIIKQVKIPSFKYSPNNSVVYGENGLPAKLFLLSAYEVGWTNVDGSFHVEGAVLDYFKGCAVKDPKRIAYYSNDSGQAAWWLRSTIVDSHKKACSIWDGELWVENFTTLCSIRPALVLPRTTLVDDAFNIIA